MIGIDFETFSRADIKKVGAWRYAEDVSTDILCMAFSINHEDPRIWIPGDLMPDWVEERIWEQGHLVEAHNVEFEKAIWRRVLVAQYDWPDVPDECWTCTAARAAAQSLPRDLSRAGLVMRLPVKKDMEGKRVMMKLARPRKPTKANPATRWTRKTAAQDFEVLDAYCIDDVRVENALSLSLRPLSATERQIWLLDQKINERGVRVDMKAVRGSLKIVAAYEAECNAEIERITKGRLGNITEIMRIKGWLGEQGVLAESLDAESVEKLLARDDLPAPARKILQFRQSLSKSSTKKLDAMLASVGQGERIRSLLMYHGAGPGRWTGKGIQIQNFPRRKVEDQETAMWALSTGDLDLVRMLYGDPMDLISSCLRGFIIASLGCEMHVADYNAIEARVLMWLSGQDDAVLKFANGDDIYKHMAAVIYNVRFSEVTPDQRQVGKQAVLGCGYGMGAPKFVDTCWDVGRQVISLNLGERAVAAYREQHEHVVNFWYAQERAAIRAVRTRKPVVEGKITWGYVKGFLYCKLPSGRCLAYREPCIKVGPTPWGEQKAQLCYWSVNSKNKKWELTRTYGGKIAENITQGTARDLMANGMLNCEAAGYDILFTVHDEVVTERPIGTGSSEELESLLCDLPVWAQGCPVKAEGFTAHRWRK